VDLIPNKVQNVNHVVQIHERLLANNNNKNKPAVLLLTEKYETSSLYMNLAHQYKSSCTFGESRAKKQRHHGKRISRAESSTIVNDISKQKQEENQRRREMGRFSYHCQAFWKDDAGGYIGMVGFHVGWVLQQVIRKRRSQRAIDLLKATRDDEDVMVNTDYKK
jgi:hypothetical protein